MKNRIGLIVLISVWIGRLIPVPAYAQQPWFETNWGGSGNDFARSVRQLHSGSIFVAGFSNSGGQGGYDIALSKLNRFGQVIWTEYYGDTLDNNGLYLDTCPDGTLLITGETMIPSNGLDIILLKIDTIGNVVWSKNYGTTATESGNHVTVCSDSGYIITGFHSDAFGSNNSYIMKTDAQGNFLWDRSMGGTDNDVGMETHELANGELVFTGDTRSFGAGGYDIQVSKLNSNGTPVWSTYYGDSVQNGCQGILLTSNNRYLSFGETETTPFSPFEFWLELLDSSGTIIWKKKTGGVGADAAFAAAETPDGGFLLTGYSNSHQPGPMDLVVVRIDSSGNTLWTRQYGGAGVDIGYEVIPSLDGGFLIAGKYVGADEQFYLLHLDSAGWVTGSSAISITTSPVLFPNPTTGHLNIQLPAGFDPIRMELHDAYGRILKSGPWNPLDQPAVSLATGCYFIRLTNADGKNIIEKFMRQ